MIFGRNTVQIYHNTATMSEISRDAYFCVRLGKIICKSVHHWRNFCPYTMIMSAESDLPRIAHIACVCVDCSATGAAPQDTW